MKYMKTFQSFYEEAVKEIKTYDLVVEPGFSEAKIEIKKELEIPSFPEYCQVDYEKVYNELYTNVKIDNIKEGDNLVWNKYKWTNTDYSEYIAEQLGTSLDYTRYISEQLDKSLDYKNYISNK